MGFIFILSSGPRSWDIGMPDMSDKWGHMVAYGILGVLIVWAVGRSWGCGAGPAAMCAFLGATAYGVANEIHQMSVPGRHATVPDALANAIGAALGGALGIVASQAWNAWRRRAARRSWGREGRGRVTGAGGHPQYGGRTGGARRRGRR
jgi:hypothetical protein